MTPLRFASSVKRALRRCKPIRVNFWHGVIILEKHTLSLGYR